jgi:hypothetical protein
MRGGRSHGDLRRGDSAPFADARDINTYSRETATKLAGLSYTNLIIL